MFRVPDSSSPPSTPDRHQSRRDTRIADASPSTTPAGPPPTSFTAASTTPAGPPPPSSAFGSAQVHAAIPYPTTEYVDSSPPPAVDEDGEGEYEAMDEDRDDMVSYEQSMVRTGTSEIFPSIARGMARPNTDMPESDELILGTESLVEELLGKIGEQKDPEIYLSKAANGLMDLWATHDGLSDKEPGIGPRDSADPLSKARFLCSLLLRLHHPPVRTSKPSNPRQALDPPNSIHVPMPEALLTWLREYHDPYPDEVLEVLEFEPNPTAHDRFWDIIYSTTLRGNLDGVLKLLKEADFRHASTAMDDGQEEPGYRGKQLLNLQRVVNRAIQVVESCPAVQSHDWNVKGNDWAIFRKRVHQALTDLESFAEGAKQNHGLAGETDDLDLTSVTSNAMSLTSLNRRLESNVPWTVYQNLNYFYGQLLGTHAEVLAASADWVEASIGLTVWWSGDEDEDQENLATSRRSHRRSRNTRAVDLRPVLAYRERLAASFAKVLASSEEPELQVNTISVVEVGLACVLESDVEGALGVIRTWSAPLSAAVVEIAQLGGWLQPNGNAVKGFDHSDLMVLSYQHRQRSSLHDEVLMHFARLLANRSVLQSDELRVRQEGWETAVQVLGRAVDTHEAKQQIETLLDGLEMTSSDRVEKIVGLCSDMGLVEQSRSIAEKYADSLVQTVHDYGGAIYYYARAHNLHKLKGVLDVLVSLCLVQSMAYPPASELDEKLKTLISSPKRMLTHLAANDAEAAEMLSTQLSGYATIRKFYDLRDDEAGSAQGMPRLRPVALKKEAAAMLMTAITSSADSIHGGLYDNQVLSILPVDGLLVLLAEALVFLNQCRRVLTLQQCFDLLKAVEDLSTAAPAIHDRCDEAFNSAVANFHGSEPPSPQRLLKQSTSGLSTESQFSLIGSAMLESGSGSADGSGVLIKGPVKRGWDCRKGLKQNARGSDVLSTLRLALAREISMAWAEGEA